MNEQQDQTGTINSIHRAFVILRLFNQSWELGIQEISHLTGLNKTTVFRVVKSLEANGVLEQNPSNSKYYPGLAILELAHGIYQNYDVKNIFLPYMKLLREEFNEDVVLSVLSGVYAVCIERLEGDNAINLHSRVGRALPLCGGSTARVFLPYLSQESLECVYQDERSAQALARPATRADLEESLAFVKQNGYLISCGVTDEGVFSISVPVRMDDTRIYSLGICGVEERMHSKGVDVLISRLLDYGKQLSEKLAYCEVIYK